MVTTSTAMLGFCVTIVNPQRTLSPASADKISVIRLRVAVRIASIASAQPFTGPR